MENPKHVFVSLSFIPDDYANIHCQVYKGGYVHQIVVDATVSFKKSYKKNLHPWRKFEMMNVFCIGRKTSVSEVLWFHNMVMCPSLWWCVRRYGDVSIAMVMCQSLWWCVSRYGDVSVAMVMCQSLWWCVRRYGDVSIAMVMCHSLWWCVSCYGDTCVSHYGNVSLAMMCVYILYCTKCSEGSTIVNTEVWPLLTAITIATNITRDQGSGLDISAFHELVLACKCISRFSCPIIGSNLPYF